MTKVTFEAGVKGFRGKMGGMIFRLMPDGSTVVSQAPPEKNNRQKKRAKLKRSPAQRAHNEHFRQAVFYARDAARENPLYAELAAEIPNKTAYNLALSDWWEQPVIHRIERGQGCIRVEASDKVHVARVRVTVLDGEGRVLEQGEAVRADGDWWELAVQAAGGTVRAEAWDPAGNAAEMVA